MDENHARCTVVCPAVENMKKDPGGKLKAFFFSVIVIEIYSTEMGKSFMVAGFDRPVASLKNVTEGVVLEGNIDS
jgi:hypothetical protein